MTDPAKPDTGSVSLRRTGSGPLVLGPGWRKVASASSRAAPPADADILKSRQLGGFSTKMEQRAAHDTDRIPLLRRWHEVDLWRHNAGTAFIGGVKVGTVPIHDADGAVVAVRYCTSWPGELGREWAFEVPWGDVEHWLTDPDGEFDPLEFVAGYPERAEFKARQERLLDALEAGWDHLVSDLLERAAQEGKP